MVCSFDAIEPVEAENQGGETSRGQPIMPNHMDNVKTGDSVLMCSKHPYVGQPYISRESATWLGQKKIKMLAVLMPGVMFASDGQTPEPNNSPTHRSILGNNISITYPLEKVFQLLILWRR